MHLMTELGLKSRVYVENFEKDESGLSNWSFGLRRSRWHVRFTRLMG
jgi:hypothetical protein